MQGKKLSSYPVINEIQEASLIQILQKVDESFANANVTYNQLKGLLMEYVIENGELVNEQYLLNKLAEKANIIDVFTKDEINQLLIDIKLEFNSKIVNMEDAIHEMADTLSMTNENVIHIDEKLDSEIIVLNNVINNKQDILESGANIKTINGESILGNGNLNIESTQPDLTEYAKILYVDESRNKLNIRQEGDRLYDGNENFISFNNFRGVDINSGSISLSSTGMFYLNANDDSTIMFGKSPNITFNENQNSFLTTNMFGSMEFLSDVEFKNRLSLPVVTMINQENNNECEIYSPGDLDIVDIKESNIVETRNGNLLSFDFNMLFDTSSQSNPSPVMAKVSFHLPTTHNQDLDYSNIKTITSDVYRQEGPGNYNLEEKPSRLFANPIVSLDTITFPSKDLKFTIAFPSEEYLGMTKTNMLSGRIIIEVKNK